jgi:hypothetical protein
MIDKKELTILKNRQSYIKEKIILKLLKVNINNCAPMHFEPNSKIAYFYTLAIANKINFKIKSYINMEKNMEFLFVILDNINLQVKNKFNNDKI